MPVEKFIKYTPGITYDGSNASDVVTFYNTFNSDSTGYHESGGVLYIEGSAYFSEVPEGYTVILGGAGPLSETDIEDGFIRQSEL